MNTAPPPHVKKLVLLLFNETLNLLNRSKLAKETTSETKLLEAGRAQLFKIAHEEILKHWTADQMAAVTARHYLSMIATNIIVIVQACTATGKSTESVMTSIRDGMLKDLD